MAAAAQPSYDNFDLLITGSRQTLTPQIALVTAAAASEDQVSAARTIRPAEVESASSVPLTQLVPQTESVARPDQQPVYTVRATSARGAEGEGRFSVRLPAAQLDELLRRLDRRYRGQRHLNAPDEQAARTLGGALFDSFFQGQIRSVFDSSREAAELSGRGLRLRLRFSSAPELETLPWEYLYDTQSRKFLALLKDFPVVRYVSLPEAVPALQTSLPLRVLVMIANERGDLNVNLEEEHLRDALSSLEAQGRVKLHILRAPRVAANLTSLRDCLRAAQMRGEPYHVFHFIGHGAFNGDEGIVYLDGGPVRGEELAIALSNYPPRLAVLNACEGARFGAERQEGTAQTLVRYGIPAVIAMQADISDKAAICFAREFYSAVSVGFPIDSSLSQARQAVSNDVNQVEWGTPVLFLRSHTGELLDIRELPVPEEPAEIAAEIDFPDGPVSFDSRFYVKRACDSDALRSIEQGLFLILRGSGQTGKTSLLGALINAVRLKGRHTAIVDFINYPMRPREFFQQFSSDLAERIGIETAAVEASWGKIGGPSVLFTSFIQQQVLPACPSGILIAMEGIDYILPNPDLRGDFFRMIGAWQTQRAADRNWHRLNLAMFTSVSPRQTLDAVVGHTLRLGIEIVLKDFTPEQVASLNRLHSPRFSDAGVDKLVALTKGHPYLVRRGMYCIAREMSEDQFFQTVADSGGPYEEHISGLLDWLVAASDRTAAWREILVSKQCNNSQVLTEFLARGLVNRRNPVVTPRCELYERCLGSLV